MMIANTKETVEIEQNKNEKIVEEWLPKAEKLADEDYCKKLCQRKKSSHITKSQTS